MLNRETSLTAGVNPDNLFVFPQTLRSMHHWSGWHDVNDVVQSCQGVTTVNATTIRHHLSTPFADSNTNEAARILFCKHLGHSLDMNEGVYQAPRSIATMQNIGRFLRSMDDFGDNLKKYIRNQ